jgi:uncharacterized protein YdaU (DUF1376 family)
MVGREGEEMEGVKAKQGAYLLLLASVTPTATPTTIAMMMTRERCRVSRKFSRAVKLQKGGIE